MAEKEKTKEEAEEARANIVKKTLDWKLMQDAVGSNIVKTNPYLYTGQLGLQSANSIYDSAMISEDAQKERNAMHNARVEEYRKKGVSGEPAYPSSGDLSYKLMLQLDEVLAVSKLSELEKAAKSVGAKLSFEVPKELQNYSYANLQKELAKYADSEGKVDIKSLGEKEQHAIALYSVLSESYKRACALKATQANYFADLNETGRKITERYKPEEKKE